MITFTASRYRPSNEKEDRIRVTTNTKLQGSWMMPTHTLRMLSLISDNEMVGQLSATPATEPGNSEWTYEFSVRIVERD